MPHIEEITTAEDTRARLIPVKGLKSNQGWKVNMKLEPNMPANTEKNKTHW